MAKPAIEKNYTDEIVVPVLSFLTVLAGILGIAGFIANPYWDSESLVAFAASLMALPGGILLWQFRHLGWLMTLTVIAVSELLVLTTQVTAEQVLGPTYFLVFTVYYGIQAYYLIIRRDLFGYPEYHSRSTKKAK